jgi:leucyl aminopeptidase
VTKKLFLSSGKRPKNACPIYLLHKEDVKKWGKDIPQSWKNWMASSPFSAAKGQLAILPGDDGTLEAVAYGLGPQKDIESAIMSLSEVPGRLPQGTYYFAENGIDKFQAALAWGLGAYDFSRYKSAGDKKWPVLFLPKNVQVKKLSDILSGVFLGRDLINTPTNDMGPPELEKAIKKLGRAHKATVKVTQGKDLLKKNFPLIHAVGRASDRAPRLVDMSWGNKKHPKITLVGKGVCFDTGGLNLKPGNSMALMKKDMGGAAAVIGLASMIMASKLPVRLRMLVPAVENNVSANAFRPSDVLPSRKGISVEIGNTDAEGRLVLADALTLADDEEPDILIDMATLTGAARVALGPDLPPFYTEDQVVSEGLMIAAGKTRDHLWPMPFWEPYDEWLSSKIADVNHISSGGFAGSITAALFLRRFVEKAKSYIHFDIYGWSPKSGSGKVYGGEPHAIRAIFEYLERRFGTS